MLTEVYMGSGFSFIGNQEVKASRVRGPEKRKVLGPGNAEKDKAVYSRKPRPPGPAPPDSVPMRAQRPSGGQASLTVETSFCKVSLASPKSMVVLGS